MKVSLNWLKEYVEINDLTPEELAEKMTRAGVAVEYLSYPGAEISGVVTGKVEEISRHPEADKLWLCQLNTGQQELVQIVTGADNVVKDCIVPVALVGSTLPGGKKMKKAKLRGLDSFGMLCSASELGIEDKLLQPTERNGIFLLPADTPIGRDIKEVLGLDDVIFEFELTANRGDCLSMLGIAREVAALTGQQVKQPQIYLQEDGQKPLTETKIEIADSHLCQRFTARTFTDIAIKPSPLWLQNRLRASGMRPISNVVDVTNYVMLEMGQPMHAYDSDTLSGNTVIARPAKAGEKLVTLDEVERTLTEGMTVIADSEKAIGLGGVMGGLQTEISPDTKYVFLEAACFDPIITRKTSRALGLISEASSRFVHGIDKANILTALDRAAQLLEEIGAAKTVPGYSDNYPDKYQPKVISTSLSYLNSRLGTNITSERIKEILQNLGFACQQQADNLEITVPSWRNDVTCAADISEEVARIDGYDNIAGTLPVGLMLQGKQSKLSLLTQVIKNFLTAAGLSEVINYSFFNQAQISRLNLAESDQLFNCIPILNPITDDFKVMRSSLLPSVLMAANYNTSHRNEDVAIFEIANTYLAEQLPLEKFPQEQAQLCLVLTGRRYFKDWNQSKRSWDFYDAKGLVEELFAKLNLSSWLIKSGTGFPYLHPGKNAELIYQEKPIGCLGCLHPKVAEAFDLPEETYILQLEIEKLVAEALAFKQYEKLPKYPEIYRDLSLLVPLELSQETVAETVQQAASNYLIKLQLFDLYTGKQIQEGVKSMSYTLTFQAAEKTLTDEEINREIEKIIASLTKLNIKLR